jgi:large subunit ribosomal protein L25
MEFITLNVNKRKNTGKGAARRMRRTGNVPAVVYGQGIETFSVSVEPRAIIQALAGPMRLNTVLKLNVQGDGKTQEIVALVRDHQYHPVRRTLQHVDFLAIDVSKPIRVNVPVNHTGRAIGEQAGGNLTQVFRALPVDCIPDRIPTEVVVDVTALELGGHITVKDIALPEGVTAALPGEQSVFTVTMPKAEKVEEVVAEGEVAEGEAVEGEEGEKKPEEGEDDAAKKDDKKDAKKDSKKDSKKE